MSSLTIWHLTSNYHRSSFFPELCFTTQYSFNIKIVHHIFCNETMSQHPIQLSEADDLYLRTYHTQWECHIDTKDIGSQKVY